MTVELTWERVFNAGKCLLHIVSFTPWTFSSIEIKGKTIRKCVHAHSYQLLNLLLNKTQQSEIRAIGKTAELAKERL